MEPVILAGIESTPLSGPFTNLSKLPREIVYQILANLDIVQILKILSHNHGYLNSCILSSTKYQPLLIHYGPRFPGLSNPGASSISNLATTTKLFMLHREICHFRKKAISGSESPAGFVLLSHHHYNKQYTRMHIELHQNLLYQVQRTVVLDQRQVAIFLPHSTGPYPVCATDNYDGLLSLWRWIKPAWIRMSSCKSRQLNIAADLLTEFPGKIALKRPLDPSQRGPRVNIDHVVRRLRGDAMRYTKSMKFPHKGMPKCVVGVDVIELLPYDQYLWMFLGTVEKYPPRNANLDIVVQMEKLPVEKGDQTPWEYPESIQRDLKLVMDGLMYLYTGDAEFVVPRIQWPEKSKEQHDPKPTFFINKEPHRMDLPEKCHRCVARYKPYDDREYEWLRAFLKVVSWMEEHLDIPEDIKVVDLRKANVT
jgi:hypothetical protein